MSALSEAVRALLPAEMPVQPIVVKELSSGFQASWGQKGAGVKVKISYVEAQGFGWRPSVAGVNSGDFGQVPTVLATRLVQAVFAYVTQAAQTVEEVREVFPEAEVVDAQAIQTVLEQAAVDAEIAADANGRTPLFQGPPPGAENETTYPEVEAGRIAIEAQTQMAMARRDPEDEFGVCVQCHCILYTGVCTREGCYLRGLSRVDAATAFGVARVAKELGSEARKEEKHLLFGERYNTAAPMTHAMFRVDLDQAETRALAKPDTSMGWIARQIATFPEFASHTGGNVLEGLYESERQELRAWAAKQDGKSGRGEIIRTLLSQEEINSELHKQLGVAAGELDTVAEEIEALLEGKTPAAEMAKRLQKCIERLETAATEARK